MMKRICDFIARWMGALVLLIALMAFFFPRSFLFIDTSLVNPFLGLVMFGMGLTLSPKDFQVVFSRPKDVLIGCCAQFVIMPSMAFLLVTIFHLPAELALGVILVGCCPGGTASNVITFLSKGDLALSVGVTAVSTLLAPLLTPFLVWLLAGTFVQVDAIGMLLSIVYVVIAPIILGFVCQRFFPKFTKTATVYLPAFSTLMIMAIVAVVVSHIAEKLAMAGALVVLVVVLHNIFGLTLGYAIAHLFGLSRKKRVALSIEVGMQNSGLATSLAVSHFATFPLAVIPGAVFSVWHNLSGALLAKFYARQDNVSRKNTLTEKSANCDIQHKIIYTEIKK